jgi:hypothetical protein
VCARGQNLRLDGGCAADDGRSSSASLDRLLRLPLGPGPRFAEAIFDRRGGGGELWIVRKKMKSKMGGKEGQGLKNWVVASHSKMSRTYLMVAQCSSFDFVRGSEVCAVEVGEEMDI